MRGSGRAYEPPDTSARSDGAAPFDMDRDTASPPLPRVVTKRETYLGLKRATAFFFLGLLNHALHFIINASAPEISAGGIGLVYIVNSGPALFLKLSLPFWFGRVSYDRRIALSAVLMILGIVLIGGAETILYVLSGPADAAGLLRLRLLGIGAGSLQLAVGEATLLARASCYTDGGEGKGAASRRCLAAWASGTGLAGPAGYLWTWVLRDRLRASLRASLLLGLPAIVLPYAGVYFLGLPPPPPPPVGKEDAEKEGGTRRGAAPESFEIDEYSVIHAAVADAQSKISLCGSLRDTECADVEKIRSPPEWTTLERQQSAYAAQKFRTPEWRDPGDPSPPSSDGGDPQTPLLTAADTFFQKMSILRDVTVYMVPLFVVYFAEYALQSGAWTVIGFPIQDEDSREWFYHNANWLYTGGVFVSRTSGRYLQASLWTLWLMPCLQVLNLVFYVIVAWCQVWYGRWLLAPPFYAGLLGGAVYVNSFTRIVKDVPQEKREMALAIVTIADTCGILLADYFGLYIQSCLFEKNNIEGAMVSCPLY